MTNKAFPNSVLFSFAVGLLLGFDQAELFSFSTEVRVSAPSPVLMTVLTELFSFPTEVRVSAPSPVLTTFLTELFSFSTEVRLIICNGGGWGGGTPP